jgi:hypothetical protein
MAESKDLDRSNAPGHVILELPPGRVQRCSWPITGESFGRNAAVGGGWWVGCGIGEVGRGV